MAGAVSRRPGLDRSGCQSHGFVMAEVPFDTLAVTRGLEARGFDAGQAEAITEAVRSGVTGGVASRADLAQVDTRLTGELTEIKAELKWIKLIGAAILAVLILPWLAEVISTTLPGP